MSAAMAGCCPQKLGLVMLVGEWFPAGNVLRGQFSFGGCCTGRWGVLVSFGTPTTTFDSSVVRGTTGVVGVVGAGIKKLAKNE